MMIRNGVEYTIKKNAEGRNDIMQIKHQYNGNVLLEIGTLHNADLHYANLHYANLRGANLHDANLHYVKSNYLTTGFHLVCPAEGSFIAWKICQDGVLVKLEIPANAKRSSATTRKCRASKAKVLAVIGGDVGISKWNNDFRYKVGQDVEVKNYHEDRWVECAAGIHFFLTKEEAEQW